jgi:toxin ParE1/3/4
MARIELVPAVLDDFGRFADHLSRFDVADIADRIAEIVQAIDILAHSPLIGRPSGDGMRELIIGRGARGYVALYRFIPEIDTVFVLAVRAQKEAGYR